MTIKRHVTHLKSKVVSNGVPKLPKPTDLLEGEIAINYAQGYETLSIKNESGTVVTFSSDNKMADLLAEKADVADFTAHTSNTEIHHTHANKQSLDAITGNVGTMAYENKTSYSSATEVESALTEIEEAVDEKINKIISLRYDDLVELRNNSQLIPGQQYRIIDYECTTVQDNTRSAGNQFDIIVTALDVNILSERAFAARHAGDTHFANCNIGAWQLWYCLDNDTVRFAWAQDNANPMTAQIDGLWYSWYANPAAESSPYPYGLKHDTTIWYSDRLTVEVGDTVYENYDGSGESATIEARQGEGKGVIYRMIDEWNNDVCYDFKNIQYKAYRPDGDYVHYSSFNIWYSVFPEAAQPWTEITESPSSIVPDLNYSNYFYTFIAGSTAIGTDDDSIYATRRCFDNTIDTAETSSSNRIPAKSLPFIVLKQQCHRVTIKGDVKRVWCYGKVRDITIYGLCSDLIIDGLHESEIRDSAQLILKNAQYSDKTTFKECSNIWSVNQLHESEFERCSNMTVSVVRKSYFREVSNVDLSSGCDNNHLENCNNISFKKSYMCYNKVEDCAYLELTSSKTTASAAKIQNLIIHGVKGTEETPKVISHETVNDDFVTTYQPVNSSVVLV